MSKVALGTSAAAVTLLGATTRSFAANVDLDTVTTGLTSGAGDMKTEFMTLIAAIIIIIIVVFGIGWLIGLFKRNMNKA